MKIRSVLRTISESTIVDVTSTPPPSRSEIQKAWVEGVMYKGVNIFDHIYDSDANMRNIHRALDDEARYYKSFDSQESYLAFDPKSDMFIMGFDCWAVAEAFEQGDDDYDVNAAGLVTFSFNENSKLVTVKSVKLKQDVMMYSASRGSGLKSGRDGLNQSYPNLIEIRLD